MDNYITPLNTGGFVRGLRLHAENCTGKNKNRYFPWYLCWSTIIGFNESVELDFMVPGHTKKVVDGAVGHINRKLKVTDARIPQK